MTTQSQKAKASERNFQTFSATRESVPNKLHIFFPIHENPSRAHVMNVCRKDANSERCNTLAEILQAKYRLMGSRFRFINAVPPFVSRRLSKIKSEPTDE
jgi:hypothetical protein